MTGYADQRGHDVAWMTAAERDTAEVPANPDWWERAVAGACSHGGHGWDGETCSDAPETGEISSDEGNGS